MKRLLTVVAAIACTAAACASSGSSTGNGGGLVSIGAGLHGPEGLKATIYAQGLTNASAMAFDAQDRLWVATAAFSDEGADSVSVITGRNASPVKVLTSLHTPLGLLWYHGGLYVSSKTGVDVYSGFNGTSFAASRTIVAIPDGTGEVNGMVLAPDGRMQLGISSPCDHCAPTSKLSASIVSFNPDGSDLQVDASGIRAPISLAYFPGTTDLFVTMNQRDDLGDQTPGDWLSIVTKGQSWGFPDCYGQGGTDCASQPKPVAELGKHAAVSGLALVTGQLGPSVGTTALVAEWATGTVKGVALTKAGSSYTSTVAPLLTGLKNPVPLVLAVGGALFVGDWNTGNVYRVAAA